MPPNFADHLADACREKKSIVCVGLDPHPDKLPPTFADEDPVTAAAAFCRAIVDAVADCVPVVKPNIAFFEALGPLGVAAYADLCAYACSKGLLVIGDIKRGDIGSTAEAYARGFLGGRNNKTGFAGHDAVTVNPYLGSDGIQPFVDQAVAGGRGIFVLVKTSNPSSAELQDLLLQTGGTVAEEMARLVDSWGAGSIGKCGFSSIGAVVGATHGGELARFRTLMPHTLFLLPGYGAQGAGAGDIIDAFRKDGLGGVVNASRSIIFAYRKESTTDFAGAARVAAERMTAALNAALKKAGKPL
ncbi:MAG: orotidine-5'-phosphate decarboxylase [Planctomycetes bacterium]|nr:orotidine-5'-phosphate decarboxylase [Planctomycetota bacterium]